jgi:hypothetical protein
VTTKEYCLLGCNTMKSIRSQSAFWRNVLLPSSVSENKLNKKPAWKQSCARHLLSCWFLAYLILYHWRWRRYVSSKCWLTFNGLHGITLQKIVLSITTTVRTSNPTNSQLVSSACFSVVHNHIISHLKPYNFALHTLLLNETRTKQIFEVSCTHVIAGC